MRSDIPKLAKIANAYQWSKKTYNNAISVIRCAFNYGYKRSPGEAQPGLGPHVSANHQKRPPYRRPLHHGQSGSSCGR